MRIGGSILWCFWREWRDIPRSLGKSAVASSSIGLYLPEMISMDSISVLFKSKGIITFPVPPPAHPVSCLASMHPASLPPLHAHTKCPGSKKFATPSLTAYSCPQHPHTSLPSCIHVSSNTRCKSCAVCDGVSSPCWSAVSSDVFDESIKSAGVGGVSDNSGRPNYRFVLAPIHISSVPALSQLVLLMLTYLPRNHLNLLPHQPRQYILQKR